MREGDQVTVVPVDEDPYVLQFQRHVTISHIAADGVYVRVACTIPPNQVVGPVPATRLLPGWRNAGGEFRRW
jgi:hypothetical protein